MPDVKKATGSGTSASISTDGGTSFKTIGSLTKASPPNMTRGTVDVTDLNSYENNNQLKEFLTDFIEAEELGIEGFVLSTDEGVSAMDTAFYAGTDVQLKIVLPSALGKTMLVKGLLTAYKPIGDITSDSGISYSASIKPTSKPTLSATVAGSGG